MTRRATLQPSKDTRLKFLCAVRLVRSWGQYATSYTLLRTHRLQEEATLVKFSTIRPPSLSLPPPRKLPSPRNLIEVVFLFAPFLRSHSFTRQPRSPSSLFPNLLYYRLEKAQFSSFFEYYHLSYDGITNTTSPYPAALESP